MNDVLVSIIIPVYNRKDLVYEMMKSIIAQTYKNWELLLIDDGSTDGIFEFCKEMAVSEPRIQVYARDKETKGAPVCRNIGLRLSRGKYIIFFDSDDLIPDFCLQQRVEYMEAHPTLDFSIFPAIAFWKQIGDIKFYSGIKVTSHALRHLIDGLLPFLVVTNIYKASFLKEKAINWDERMRFFQDQDFNINCLLQGAVYEYATNARFDYYYRSIHGSNSISRRLGDPKNFDGHLYFISKLSLLPLSVKKENSWAIRRRIIYIYRLLLDSFQREQIVYMFFDHDKLFFVLLKISNCLYKHFTLLGLNKKSAFFISYPYYSLYNKLYTLCAKYKIRNCRCMNELKG